jgi:Ala-tRNA(Pro) deacylase
MAIAMTLQQYLANHGSDFELVEHARTMTATRTAQAGHVPGDRLAKAVVVKDDDSYMMAVLPASCHVELGQLADCLNRRIGLATEPEVSRLFGDCEVGAVPPIGPAYGLDVILDDRLASAPDVFFEGGDHETLVHVSGDEFLRLLGPAAHGQFARHD